MNSQVYSPHVALLKLKSNGIFTPVHNGQNEGYLIHTTRVLTQLHRSFISSSDSSFVRTDQTAVPNGCKIWWPMPRRCKPRCKQISTAPLTGQQPQLTLLLALQHTKYSFSEENAVSLPCLILAKSSAHPF